MYCYSLFVRHSLVVSFCLNLRASTTLVHNQFVLLSLPWTAAYHLEYTQSYCRDHEWVNSCSMKLKRVVILNLWTYEHNSISVIRFDITWEHIYVEFLGGGGVDPSFLLGASHPVVMPKSVLFRARKTTFQKRKMIILHVTRGCVIKFK